MLSGAAPLTLQLPSGITDKIRASCTLARDEALIFAGNQASLDGQSRALLGVLTAENAGP